MIRKNSELLQFSSCATLFVAFALAVVPACKSRINKVNSGGGRALATASAGSVTLEVDSVARTKKKIEVDIRVINNGPKEIRFKIDDVSLLYKGTAFRAKDYRLTKREFDIDVKPNERKMKYWAFEVEGEPVPGNYALRIVGIDQWENHARIPMNEKIEMIVNVP